MLRTGLTSLRAYYFKQQLIDKDIMKAKNKLKIMAAVFTLALFVTLANKAKAQTVNITNIIPDSVGVWGPPLEVDMAGTLCVFRIRVVKHKGTTCNYDVEITNKGNKTLTAVMGLLTESKQVDLNTAGRVTVKPGESYYWHRQKYGVRKRGVENQALVCKTCNPILGFHNLKVGGVYVN